LRAQRRWWRARWRATAGSDVLFPTAGRGMVAVDTLAAGDRTPGLRIAILHATAGSGHKRAAQALAAAFTKRSPGIVVREVDTLVYASRLYRGTYAASYNAMAARAPRLWGALYHSWELAPVNRGTAPVRLALDRLNLRRLVRVVERERPDAVVCTHFLPMEALSAARGGGGLDVPLFGVITDFSAHPFWAFPHVNHYFVATDRTAEELAGHGVPRDAIQVTGIPVDPRFADTVGREEARRRLGIRPNARMVLLMGGGSGVGPLASLAERLARLPSDPEVVVVCGTNAKLREEVEDVAARMTGRVRSLGFTDQVDLLLEACDVVVGKAGGLTCSEALIKRAPLVVFRPTPGQEVRNAEQLAAAGAAIHADAIEEVEDTVQRLLTDDRANTAMRAAAGRMGRPHSAEEIVESVLAALTVRTERRA
jgi:processive 1,2-diacylglycerol beta-glucosyltransferase